jgi:hypothetical protein
VDFMPYEGAPVARGNDFKRLVLVVSITAVIVLGAGWLAALTPVPSLNSFEGAMEEAAMTAPSAVPVISTVSSSSMLANIADSDSDMGPGSAESELALHPVAKSKLVTAAAAKSKLVLLPAVVSKLAIPKVATR